MQCKAKTKNGGKPCRAQAIAGGTVCRMHGGGAPQVREAARLRILELVDPALATLYRSLKLKGPASGVALAAAKDVLDRAGLKAPDRMEFSGAEGGPIEIHIGSGGVVSVNLAGYRDGKAKADSFPLAACRTALLATMAK